MSTVVLAVLIFLLPSFCRAITWTSTPFGPPSVPLAVRSPYLSAWLAQGAGTALNGAWPTFWNGDIVGWAGFVNVDGTSYTFMGSPSVPSAHFNASSQQSVRITSTQSTFVMTAGPVDLTVQFLSPVEPTSLVNQSIPFSYMAMSAAPNDGKSHKVQVYSDISAEWLSGNDSMIANWTTTTGDIITHQLQLENQTLFADVDDRIQQGSAYYSTLSGTGVTWQTGRDIDVRAQFINNSVLLNTQNTSFRAISDDWPVFALAHDLGTISSQSETVVISIGLARDPVIEYITADNVLQHRSSYFWSQYSTIGDLISTFLGDYTNAVARAEAFDSRVVADAGNTTYPPNYSAIVEMSIRQAFGAIEITVSKDSSGGYNTSDVTAFLKEISSSGHVSTTDVIYPMWPLFLYTNPALGKAMLLPLLEYQATGQYPNQWACHDLGPTYPQAVGYPKGNDVLMPVEESGNMLIMTLSYTQWTKDTSLISSYNKLLDQWAQYLVANALTPAEQLSSDAFAGALANQTNLAIKGIIGIRAMAEMSGMIGDASSNSSYASTAESYVSQWVKLATATDNLHLTLSYGNDSSWGLTYNMYADKLLQTNIIPKSVYDTQSSWYSDSNNENSYGIPLDTRHSYTLTGWEIWTAAIVTDQAVQTALINDVHDYVSDTQNNEPFGDWYDTKSGKTECSTSTGCFRARPDVGAHLALMVMSPANVTNTTGSSPNGPSSTSTGSSPSHTSKTSSGEHTSQAKWPTLIAAMAMTVMLPLVSLRI